MSSKSFPISIPLQRRLRSDLWKDQDSVVKNVQRYDRLLQEVALEMRQFNQLSSFADLD
jgi:hypothetical protein